MKTPYAFQHQNSELSLTLESSPALVGRSDNCDLQVDKETLSREHARLFLKEGVLYLEDLHSTNGSFVNEQQIFEATRLRPGDLVRFGQETFCVQSEGSDATQMFNRDALSQLGSSMLVEDHEEADGTVMLQAISLPVGWEKAAVAQRTHLSEEDEGLVNALKLHARKKLRHPHGLMISIIEEHRAPSVKLLSTENTQASWIVGRGENASIQLTDARVSDPHLSLAFNNGCWSFEDLDSRNGTLERGAKTKGANIEQATELHVGPYALLIETLKQAQ